MSNVVSSRVSKTAVEEASKATEAARSDLVAASSQRASALVDTLSKASSKSFITRSSSSHGRSGFEEIGQSADALTTLVRQGTRTTNLTDSQFASAAFSLSGGLGVGVAGANANASKSYGSNLTEAEQKVKSHLSSDQVQEFKKFADRTTRDTEFLRAISSEGRDGHELAARLSSTTARTESAQAAFTERQAVAERLSTSYESGESISIDLAQLPANSLFVRRYYELADRYGSGSQALQIAMASELASHALPPTHRFSGGSALPSTFGDVRTVHDLFHLGESSLQGSIVDQTATMNAASVHAGTFGPQTRKTSGSGKSSSSSPNPIRSEVRARGVGALQQNNSFIDEFDARNDINRSADGAVTTRRSQHLQNVRKLRDDVNSTGEDVLKAIKGDSGQPREAPGNFKHDETNVAP